MKQTTVKELMKNGVVSLLTKKKFIDITVTDLIKESGVARASFYRIYRNVDQVLDDVVEDFKNKFKKGMLPYLLSKDEENIKKRTESFLVSFKNKEILLFDVLPDNLYLIIAKIEQTATLSDVYHPDATIESKYIPGLVLTNIIMILKIWEKYGFKETPEELTDFIFRMIGKKYLNV